MKKIRLAIVVICISTTFAALADTTSTSAVTTSPDGSERTTTTVAVQKPAVTAKQPVNRKKHRHAHSNSVLDSASTGWNHFSDSVAGAVNK
jgi:hypothetical protein